MYMGELIFSELEGKGRRERGEGQAVGRIRINKAEALRDTGGRRHDAASSRMKNPLCGNISLDIAKWASWVAGKIPRSVLLGLGQWGVKL